MKLLLCLRKIRRPDLLNNELKLCPFCGGHAKILDYEDGNGGYYSICECESCGAKSSESNSGQRYAAKAWNKRIETVAITNACSVIQPFADLYKDVEASAEDSGYQPLSDVLSIGLIYPDGGSSNKLTIGNIRAAFAFVEQYNKRKSDHDV
jgi:Lar family restriction alleviation protein